MLKFRNAKIDDLMLYFDWANDENVRKQSFNSEKINFEIHKKWFESKIQDKNCLMLIFINKEGSPIGQVRIHKENNTDALIGISISDIHRGKGYSVEMLKSSSNYFLQMNPNFSINAFIKQNNLTSKIAFEKADFKFIGMQIYQNHNSYHFKKQLCE